MPLNAAQLWKLAADGKNGAILSGTWWKTAQTQTQSGRRECPVEIQRKFGAKVTGFTVRPRLLRGFSTGVGSHHVKDGTILADLRFTNKARIRGKA